MFAPAGSRRSRPSSRRTVQLRREESRRGLQDLVRPPQLTAPPVPARRGVPRRCWWCPAGRRRRSRPASPTSATPPGEPRAGPAIRRIAPTAGRRIPAGLDRQPGRTLTQLIGVLLRCGIARCSSQVSMSPSNPVRDNPCRIPVLPPHPEGLSKPPRTPAPHQWTATRSARWNGSSAIGESSSASSGIPTSAPATHPPRPRSRCPATG